MTQNPLHRPHGLTPLAELIRERIEQSPLRAIPFRDYMELCLYHETYGYYCRNTVKIGKDGDFYTSASIGTIMGDMLGHFFVRIAAEAGWGRGPLRIAEWGGGTGRLAGQILDAIASRAPELYDCVVYDMVERSPYHRDLQREELRRHANVRHMEPDEWFALRPEGPAIVFSNELLDAFPVHRIVRRNGRLYEIFVGWNREEGRFEERLFPIGPGPLDDFLRAQSLSPREGQTCEANPEAADWIRRIGGWLDEGCLVTIDYGDTVEELLAPHRMRGTLLCYRRHQVHDDPYVHVGEQDMTAHVNFTACIRAGAEAGFASWTLRTQRQFLLDEGVLELLVSHDGRNPFGPEARRNRAIRQLLLGDSGSELFKVLVQTKKR